MAGPYTLGAVVNYHNVFFVEEVTKTNNGLAGDQITIGQLALNGLYVWTQETSTDQAIDDLIAACTVPSRRLNTILLSNYQSSGYLRMHPAAGLHTLNTRAHQAGLSVYALYTNKDWIDELLQYNAECTDPLQRFDGLAMDYESVPTAPTDIQYYADALTAVGTLPLHVSISWTWDNLIAYGGQTKPAYEHIIDIVNSLDVQVVFETVSQIEFRAADEVRYAAQQGKAVFMHTETQDLAGSGDFEEWHTFFEEGEAFMWSVLDAVDFDGDPFAGFILHHYGDVYSSGTALWPDRGVGGASKAVADAAGGTGARPEGYALLPNRPNPFNPSTQIAYRLPQAGAVALVVYNLMGQSIRVLDQGYREAGAYQMQWDGRDGQGRQVASGVYLFRLTSGAFSQTRQMVLLK